MPRIDLVRSSVRNLEAYAIALGAVAVTTLALEAIGRLRVTNGSMLYLAAVLLVALTLGRGPAVVAAISAALAFDFFFVEPRFTLRVDNPDEWLVLLTFLLVALVVSQLVVGQRRRAEEAEARRREAILLHDLGALLVDRPFEPAIEAVAALLRSEAGADAVSVEISGADLPDTSVVVGDQGAWRASVALPFTQLADGGDGQPAIGRWIRIAPPRAERGRKPLGVVRAPIRAAGQLIGQISLVNADPSLTSSATGARLLATAAAQLAMAVDREQLRGEATEAEALRRTSDLKTALLNAVSHDLRTPLAAIIASAGSLRQADVAWSAEDQSDFAENIEREAERLNRIVGNVLDLGRIEGGALRPARDWHDPALLLTDTVGRMRAHALGIDLQVRLTGELPPVLLDPVEIDQVLTNLLENAVRHAPPGSAVSVSGCVDAEGLRVSVADRGPGIGARAMARIFEPFYRMSPGAGSGGSGIGLAVARGLVAAHGGRIWAENRAGGGAQFTFVIPSSRAPESADG